MEQARAAAKTGLSNLGVEQYQAGASWALSQSKPGLEEGQSEQAGARAITNRSTKRGLEQKQTDATRD